MNSLSESEPEPEFSVSDFFLKNRNPGRMYTLTGMVENFMPLKNTVRTIGLFASGFGLTSV